MHLTTEQKREMLIRIEAERKDMAERTHAVIDAALQWWRARRPVGWSEAQHLAQPTVNTTTPREAQLASAVAEFLGQNMP